MLETFYISTKFFSPEEIKAFKNKHGYHLNEIKYSSTGGEIDFSIEDEKEFLLKKGFPKISARFFS